MSGNLDMSSPQDTADRVRREITDNLSHVFERASAYTSLIMLGGYTGVFTIWNFTRAQLTKNGSASVAILLTISLTTFILFEITKMIFMTKRTQRVRKIIVAILPPDEFLERLEELQHEERTTSIKWLMLTWWTVLAITVTTAFTAVLILLWNFLAVLLAWPLWP